MKNSKLVNLLFLTAGALVWFITLHYLGVWIGYFQLPRRIGAEYSDFLRHGLPIVLGVLTFVILRANLKASHFVSEAVDELTRVVFSGLSRSANGYFSRNCVSDSFGYFFWRVGLGNYCSREESSRSPLLGRNI